MVGPTSNTSRANLASRPAVRSLLSVLSAVLVVLSSAAGCGGQTENVDNTDAGQDAAWVGQGGTLADPCPAAQPHLQGDPCTTPDLRCEYGGAGPHLRCDFILQCDATSHWTVEVTYGDCAGTQADNASFCPKSFAALASGSACPPSRGGGPCVYAEGLCGCSNCSTSDGGHDDYAGLWSCDRWPAPPSPCPPPRPRIGSACTTEGQQCAYQPVCSPLIFDQRNLKCSNGLWQDETIVTELCPTYPRCGK